MFSSCVHWKPKAGEVPDVPPNISWKLLGVSIARCRSWEASWNKSKSATRVSGWARRVRKEGEESFKLVSKGSRPFIGIRSSIEIAESFKDAWAHRWHWDTMRLVTVDTVLRYTEESSDGPSSMVSWKEIGRMPERAR
jgi:hypothetical protein